MSNNLHLFISLIIWVIIGAITAHYAQKRGRNYYNWFLIGLLFGLFGLIALFLFPKIEQKQDPSDIETFDVEPEVIEDQNVSLEKEWFYLDTQDIQHGPVSTEYLKRILNQQIIRPETYVWSDGMPDWKKIKDFPEIF